MIFTGDTFRSILDRDKLTFSVNASINNLTGSGSFGFSGEGSTMQWVFNQGKIFDPEGSYVYSYEADQRVNLSGAISGSGYQYHLDEKPILFGGDKYTGKTQGFYFNLSGCEANATVAIKTDEFNYSLTFPTEFTYNEAITGHLSGIDSGYNFQVFSGLVHSPSDFTITGLDTSRNGVVPIKIKCTDASGAKINNTYQFDVDLYTNFGTISKQFSGTSVLADPTQGSVLSLSANTPSGTDSISVSDSSTSGYKDYTLDYTLTNNLALVTGEMPIDVQLTHSSGDTGDFVNGHKVTGVQLGSVGNSYFTGTPTITFSSTNSGDIQASGTPLLERLSFFNPIFYISGGSSIFPNFYSLVGINITSSGSYLDPTDITISISGNEFSQDNLTGAMFNMDRLVPRLLDYTATAFGYYDTPWRPDSAGIFSPQYPNLITGNNISNLFSGDSSQIKAIPLTTSGDSTTAEFTGRWNISTGTISQINAFNTGSEWSAIYTGYENESGHPSGNQVSGDGYRSTIATEENNVAVRVHYKKPNAGTGTNFVGADEVKIITNYLSGEETEHRTFSNLYQNPPTISKSSVMTGMPIINALKDVVTGTILQGSTGSIDIKYSFIESGTSGANGLGTIKRIGDYNGNYPALSFDEMTGGFVTGFEYWKSTIEYAFTGLTVNFVNLGVETTTGVATSDTYAVGTNNIGDIRIGASDNISTESVYYPVSGNNFGVSGTSGSNIFIASTGKDWKDESSRYYYDTGLASYVNPGGISISLTAAYTIGRALGIANEFDSTSVTHPNFDDTNTGYVGFITPVVVYPRALVSGRYGPCDDYSFSFPSICREHKTERVASGYLHTETGVELIYYPIGSGEIAADIDAFTYLYGNPTGTHTVYEEKDALPDITGGGSIDLDSIATLSISGSGSLSTTKNITGDYS